MSRGADLAESEPVATAGQQAPTSRAHVPISTKLFFSMGGAAEGSVNWAFSGFNFIIYTIGFGLPGTLAGLAVSLSIIFDAVSDPLVGFISDRWQSTLGRRHPFIYLAALPLGATIFCIYVPPPILLQAGTESWSFLGYSASPSQWALAAWLFVFASLMKLFLTCYHLPHLALGAELTDDYLERTRLFRYNTLFSFGGGAALAWCFYNVFYPNGPYLHMGTTVFAGSVALFGAVVIFLTAFLTRDQIPNLPKAPPGQPPFSWGEFGHQALLVFRNRNYLMLFLGLLFLSPMIGVRETLNANMGLYYWELPPRLLGYLPLVSMSSYFVSMALVAYLNARFEKGGTMRGAVLLALAAAALPVTFRSLGWLPENGSPWIIFIVGASVFFYYGSLAALTTSVYSAIGDVVDEHELHSGQRQEGIFYAVRTFFAKMSNALGHLLAGIAIDVIGFPAGAVIGEVDPAVIYQLGVFEGIIATLPVLGAVYFYGRYKIDKQRHGEILQQLQARRLQGPGQAPDA
ncbi:MAG: MFS transporter [Pseudomonadales bacterium]